MATRYIKKMVLAAVTETTSGTYEAPDVSTDAILASDVTISYEDQSVKRDLLRDYFGASDILLEERFVSIEFSVEMAGSGTAGTAPAYGSLLTACAMAADDQTSYVAYTPVSESMDTVSILYALDGVLHKIRAGMGSLSMSIARGAKPTFKFKISGLEESVTAASNPTGTVLTGFKTPVAVNATNTGNPVWGCSYAAGVVTGGTGMDAQSVTLDLGVSPQYTKLMGSSTVDIASRESSAVGKFVPTAAEEAQLFADAKAGTLRTFSVKHGATAGNIVQFYMPQVQVATPTYEPINGKVGISVNMTLMPSSAGNDELVIIIK